MDLPLTQLGLFQDFKFISKLKNDWNQSYRRTFISQKTMFLSYAFFFSVLSSLWYKSVLYRSITVFWVLERWAGLPDLSLQPITILVISRTNALGPCYLLTPVSWFQHWGILSVKFLKPQFPHLKLEPNKQYLPYRVTVRLKKATHTLNSGSLAHDEPTSQR